MNDARTSPAARLLPASLQPARLPLVSSPRVRPAADPAAEAQANALLDSIAENLLRLYPEQATTLGSTRAPGRALRSHADRPLRRRPTARRADVFAPTWRAPRRSTLGRCRIPTRTSVEVVRIAPTDRARGLRPALRRRRGAGEAGATRLMSSSRMPAPISTCPSFLDSDHPIENAGRRRGLSCPASRLPAAARRRARPDRRRSRQGAGPAGLPDRQGARGSWAIGHEGRARAAAAWSNRSRAGRRRRTSRAIGPAARAPIATAEGRAGAGAPDRRAQGRSARVATDDAGHVGAARTATNIIAGRSRPRPPPTMTPDEVHQMGLEQFSRASWPDGPDPEAPRLHAGHGRRADEGAGQGPALQFPEATRAAPRSWPSSRSA